MEKEKSDQDIQLRDVSILFDELHKKFSENFALRQPQMGLSSVVEARARTIWKSRSQLEHLAAQDHQRQLLTYLDEIFGDSLCACYTSLCGLHVPARALFRRCLELGLTIVAYWDSPASFWGWREHDEDIKFAVLFDYLQSRGFQTLCEKQARESPHNLMIIGKDISSIYRDLSNTVHPKPRLFATRLADAYAYRSDEVADTLGLGAKMLACVGNLLAARFPELSSS